jgi:hypothetical protein
MASHWHPSPSRGLGVRINFESNQCTVVYDETAALTSCQTSFESSTLLNCISIRVRITRDFQWYQEDKIVESAGIPYVMTIRNFMIRCANYSMTTCIPLTTLQNIGHLSSCMKMLYSI